MLGVFLTLFYNGAIIAVFFCIIISLLLGFFDTSSNGNSSDSTNKSDSRIKRGIRISKSGRNSQNWRRRRIIRDTNSSNNSNSDSSSSPAVGECEPSANGGGQFPTTADKRPLIVSPSVNPSNSEESERLAFSKAFHIANELLTTEMHYVSRLHLIDQVFHFRVDQENRNSNMFPQDTVTTIFSNIKSIYKFHAEFLLPQLKERMESWHTDSALQKIGDIMMRNAPFLKMYTEYVKNFDTAMTAINTHYAKNSKFAGIMDEIHRMPECEQLSLQHHMLSPIQRIPRYELLLRDYIHKLPESAPDRAHAQSALKQVSQAAAHANDSMKRIEQFKKLLEVQESIGGSIDLVSPTREVLKEGRIVKISARTGDHQDRYLFLLSDLLLLCSPRKSMISGPQFGLRARFEVDNIQVLEGDNLVTANTFYVRDDQKTVELYTTTRKEKDEWLEALLFAINSLYTRKSSLRVGREILRPLDSEIGKKQPHMQKVENVSKCADCGTQFSILKHKHNCRTCGAVFCGKCSDYKFPLPWEEGRKGRICRACYAVLTNTAANNNSTSSSSSNNNNNNNNLQLSLDVNSRPRGLLEVSASSACVHSGWLVLKSPTSRSSTAKRYFLLLPDFVLYSFRTTEDTVALTATPVPGFEVSSGDQLKGDSNAPEKDRDKVMKLEHVPSKRMYYFAGTSAEDVRRWAEVLRLASRAELPPEDETNPNSDTRSVSSTEYENS